MNFNYSELRLIRDSLEYVCKQIDDYNSCEYSETVSVLRGLSIKSELEMLIDKIQNKLKEN